MMGVAVHADSGDDLPGELPPFDLPAALARCNGMTKLIRRLMVSFQRSYATAAADLRRHLAEGRAEDAERLAHSLKGAAATLGALELAQLAGEMERVLREHQSRDLSLLLSRLEKALDAALAAANSLGPGFPAGPTAARPEPARPETVAPPELAPSAPSAPSAPAAAAQVAAAQVPDAGIPMATFPQPYILVIDDEPSNIDLLVETFDGYCEVRATVDGDAALAMVASRKPDLILLDVMMPGLDGYEVCRLLKQNPETSGILVVFITGLNDEVAELKGLGLGAADFVHKPINSVLVKARVDNLIRLKRAQEQLVCMAAEKHSERLAEVLERAAEKEQLNNRLAQALADREVLLKEVHHRVKNNLQVVCSMLGMQADTLDDSTAVSALQNSQNRVQSMAIVHEMLYGSGTLSDIDFTEYTHRLLAELAASFGVDPSMVRLRADPAALRIDLDHAIPCGLILNELITNSLKYGFREGRGHVEVALRACAPGRLLLSVEDGGDGLPAGLDISKTRSLGLRIVHILVKQLSGELTVNSDRGARFEVTFPLKLESRPA
jgi:two-component sensor histidine kinase/HPt (histidine-containing phosphotransfer) domain-containing protein